MIPHSEIVKNIIVTANGKKHQYYEETNKYAITCTAFVTGKYTDKILRKYSPRESEEAFKQRVELTHNILKGVNARIMSPFDKGQRSTAVTNEVKLKSETNSKENTIIDGITHYWGNESLTAYMNERFKQLSFTDPNAFIVIEKTKRHGKEIVYPFEVSSAMAVNYSKFNNVLEWLIVETKEGEGENKKKSYTAYTDEYDIKADVFTKETLPQNLKTYSYEKQIKDRDFDYELLLEDNVAVQISTKYWLVLTLYQHNLGQIQAIEVGYLNDPDTGGLTYLSPFDSAIPRMENTLQTISELDLTTRLHAFPQKFEFVEDCTGFDNEPCANGKDHQGNTCKNCKGTGYQPTHTSAQDVVRIKKPRDRDIDSTAEILKLADYVHYTSPPIDLVKFQAEYSEKLQRECINDVFVSEAFTRSTTTATATEINVDMDAVYDTITPYLARYSQVYVNMAWLKIKLNDHENQVKDIIHKFPKDLKIKTTAQLFEDLKIANDANAPEVIKAQITHDIANKLYQDTPYKLKRFERLMEHLPFGTKTNDEKLFFISSQLTSDAEKHLYANFDKIINEIVNDQMKKGIDFYEMPYEKRQELIDAKVDAIISEKETETRLPQFTIDEDSGSEE